MKRNFIKIISCIAIAAAATSCNDWLDGVPNKSGVSEETVWDTPENASAYVSGFYTFIDKYGQFGGNQYSGALTESLTDAFKYGSSALVARGGHNNQYVMMPEVITVGSHYYSVWSTAYGNIRRINQFLRDMEKYSTFDEESEKIWEAQARFFRAYVYFQLAKRHPGVILYDELPTDGQRDRSTEEETWDFIEKDLDFAASVLPKTWPSTDEGRITYGAVMGFKSRVMLYAKRWQKAYDAAAEVEKLEQEGIYGLVNDYTQAWKGKNKEALIQFFYATSNGPSHSFDQNYVPECDGYAYGATGTPTQEMVECYETKDGQEFDWTPWHDGTATTRPPYEDLEPRFHASIIYPGSSWKGRVMDCSEDGINGVYMDYDSQNYSWGKTTTGYFLKKLLDETLIDVNGTPSHQTWVELRYAEVLLNKAEAAYMLGKSASEYQALMNRVRARVNLPAKTSEGEEWLADYRKERKVELAYEGHLFWDMVRWRRCHIDYNNYRCHGFKINDGEYKYVDVDGADRRFLEKTYIVPIPADELRNNLLLKQYPEWL